ncbi:MAG: excinuclease ABC subunit UvrA [Candidatus Magasanikbacteria bacterium]|nr:excinuclease ABC subunit UvrA [Candidatus Magasanikbacteria bacterium]
MAADKDQLIIRGARAHNLKNITVTIPKNKLTVVTGLSGSGKSSLAFDTIYAEGQRRYAESLSAYARQFMDTRDKPAVDSIVGLSPTIAIDQRVSVQNPRSTVGTATEIYDHLRLLFATVGTAYCPDCHLPVRAERVGEIASRVRHLARSGEAAVYTPLVRRAAVDAKQLMETVEQSGLEWVRVDGELMRINDLARFTFTTGAEYTVELLVGKITDIKRQDPLPLVEKAADLGNGLVVVATEEKSELHASVGLCQRCGKILPPVEIRSFSFNSPHGACPRCTGLGVTMEVDPNLVVPNNRLTLAEGAIQPWTRLTGNQSWYQKLLAAVAERYQFSLRVAVGELPAKVMDTILYGSGEERYRIDNKEVNFPGVIPDLLQKHLETTSEYVRKEIEQYMREQVCPICQGRRLRREALAVRVADHTIAELSALSVEELRTLLSELKLPAPEGAIGQPIIAELNPRLSNLVEVGLGYLSLHRSLNTLSGGEVTRVRLATQLSAGLTGVIYVLDEPSVGLHPRDNERLIGTLKYLRDLGNTVIVVEHDPAMMLAADYLIDIGPGAGIQGGEVLLAGTLAEVKRAGGAASHSLTAGYLWGGRRLEAPPAARRAKAGKSKEKVISIVGASAFNLKNVTVDIPLGKLVCVTGVSGSGKSSLIIHILSRALAKHFFRAKEEPGTHKAIKGLGNINKVIAIDQTPIGRTPRSNPATYTGVFTPIRDLFASLTEARMRGYDAGKFSFNVKGGRCEACSGDGYVRIPMQFLADVFVECTECGGLRYNAEALEIHYRNKTIADVLAMTVDEAARFFADLPAIAHKLQVLSEVGLGYIELGQPATTISGGEAQRIKLAQELARASTGATLYILDEPTTGLHFEDTKRLMIVLRQLVDKGNSVIIIEHNLDVIRAADWVIDLGPEGGTGGGEVVAVGSPAAIKKCQRSWTGRYL